MIYPGGKPLVCQAWSELRVEQYFLNLLSAEENQAFESHILRCGHCQERVEDEMNSLLALRRAAEVRLGHARDSAVRERFAYAL